VVLQTFTSGPVLSRYADPDALAEKHSMVSRLIVSRFSAECTFQDKLPFEVAFETPTFIR